jgi:hypothetical protein
MKFIGPDPLGCQNSSPCLPGKTRMCKNCCELYAILVEKRAKTPAPHLGGGSNVRVAEMRASAAVSKANASVFRSLWGKSSFGSRQLPKRIEEGSR